MTHPAPASIAISDDGRRIVVTWSSGGQTAAPAAWLYDNAVDGFDPASGHRRHSALALAGAQQVEDAQVEDGAVRLRFAPGGEVRRVAFAALAGIHASRPEEPLPWPNADAITSAPAVDFRAYLEDDDTLGLALAAVVRHGIVFFSNAGTEPRSVERLVARFGYVRETNYGRLFDVREEAVAAHLAYTATGLDLHTDNPYRDPVPTLQALHVIEAAASGGESRFADGFAHAVALKAEAPERFAILAETPVEFAYMGPSGERYAAHAPVIESSTEGAVTAVRVNHRALRSPPPDVAERWYEAYLDFYERLHAPRACLQRRLAPGEVVLMDNRRVLHGRSAYQGGAEGRWLQGCYADMDGLRATLSRLAGDASTEADR
ncbi:MAG TPA: TauD/TfdA family dioxygenase [Caulobacteraceae bacterium]